MNKFNLTKKFIIKYFVISLGFVVFVLYMWNRFFRERTPKNLPLNLNIIYLVILIYICLLFGYLIYSLIFPKKSNVILENLIELLFTPLKELDMFLKNIPTIKPYYFRIIIYLFGKVEDIIINSNKFFYMFWLFPRLILLIALVIDVFVFYRFHYKYMVILFGLLLFFNKYLMYSLKYYKKQIIDDYKNEIETISTDYVAGIHPSEAEEDYNHEDSEPIPTMTLPFETFVEFQVKSIVYDNTEHSITSISETLTLHNQYWIHYAGHPDPIFFNKPIPEDYVNNFGDDVPSNYQKAHSFIYEQLQEHLKDILQTAVRVSSVIEYYKKTSNQDFKIKLMKIVVYGCYLTCWLYVLFISAKTYTISLQDIQLIANILLNLQDSSNAFSGIPEIKDDHLIFFYEKNLKFHYYLYYHIKLLYLSKLFIMCLVMYKVNTFVKTKSILKYLKSFFKHLI